MSQATRRLTAWHRPRRRWLHPEPDDLREAAHANGAPVTRAESAFRVPARAEGLRAELTVRNGHPAAPYGTHAAAGYDARWRAGAGTLATVRVVITEIGWDGSIRRRAVGTGSLVRGFAANRLIGAP